MINATRYRLDAEINRQAALAKRIAHVNTQISTGIRLLAPSDDPIASARIAEIGRTQADQEAWTRNLGTAANLAADGYTALGTLKTSVDRALSEFLAARSGAASDEARAIAVATLRDIASQITELSAARDARGEPLFRATPLEIPVGPGIRITPVAGQEQVFGPIVINEDGDTLTLADIVTAAADALEEPDPDLREQALTEALDSINRAIDHVVLVQGGQNLRGERIDMLEKSLEANGLDLAEQRSDLESTDPLKAIAEFKALDLTLSAAQAVFAQASQRSLFDLLK